MKVAPTHFRSGAYARGVDTLTRWLGEGYVFAEVDTDEDGGLDEAVPVSSIARLWEASRPIETEARRDPGFQPAPAAVFGVKRRRAPREVQDAILGWLDRNDEGQATDIAFALEDVAERAVIRTYLWQLADRGLIVRQARGRYARRGAA